MIQMRLIKKREQDTSPENDLRGLGSDLVITQASPIACLTTIDLDPARIKNISEKFGLSLLQGQNTRNHHFIAGMPKEGDHKLQAITLLGAAISILQAVSSSSIHLDIVNPSKIILRQKKSFSNISELIDFHYSEVSLNMTQGIHLSDSILDALHSLDLISPIGLLSNLIQEKDLSGLKKWFSSNAVQLNKAASL
jgi:hypothetical protein